jgi:hypothetical protein
VNIIEKDVMTEMENIVVKVNVKNKENIIELDDNNISPIYSYGKIKYL